MNIEDIKKEIRKLYTYLVEDSVITPINTYINNIGTVNIEKVFEILDKYKEKECDYKKYKTMWEELYSEREKPCSIEYMQDLEDKYKIEVE